MTAVAVLAVRFVWIDPTLAGRWVMHGAYWAMLGLLVWLVCCLRSLWVNEWRAALKFDKKILPQLAVVGIVWVLLQAHEPHRLKVNYDESVLVAISKNMHLEHRASWPSGANLIEGAQSPGAEYVDKRPVLFPAIVSLVHTFSGYRVENAFVVNAVVSGVLLMAFWAIGRRYSREYGGILAVLLVGGIPLVAQNATGAGFDLMNAMFIVVLGLCSISYLEKPSVRLLELTIVVSLLLANTRYESIIYVLIPVVLAAVSALRDRAAPELPRLLFLAPLAVLPALLCNAVFQSSETFFQMARDKFWSLGNYSHNIEHAVYYMFNFVRGGTNSLLLSSVGLVAAIGFVLLMVRRVSSKSLPPVETQVLVLVGAFIVFNTILALGLGWGEWDDPMVSRFTLPFWMLLAWLTLELFRHLAGLGVKNLMKGVTLVCGAYFVLFALADSSAAKQTANGKVNSEIYWTLSQLRIHDPLKRGVVYAESSLPYTNEGYASQPIGRSLVLRERYIAVVRYDLYPDVFVVMREIRNVQTGAWMPDTKTLSFLASSKVQCLATTNVDPFYRVKLLKILEIKDENTKVEWPAPKKDESENQHRARVYDLMP